MKVVIFAGPSTSGKTSVLKHSVKRLMDRGVRLAFLKIDVQFADEDILFKEMGVPSRKIYSGDLCPDHCTVVVLGEAIKWARDEGAEVFFVETAGLCLRCSPYIENSLGIAVLEATSGINLPKKIGPMLTLADVAVITKIDLISQAEREVFRAGIQAAARMPVIETDALHGINIEPLVRRIEAGPDVKEPLLLKGSPPLAVCTICAGVKKVGWENHYGIVRGLDTDLFYRGQ